MRSDHPGECNVKVGSLFSGIGGFDLGFENAGLEVVWQVEQDKHCLELLEHKWPDAKRYMDVRDVGGELETVDVICGGFPCQDLSVAGRRAGLAGERSGLWFEFGRIIGELCPRTVVIENVPGLLSSNSGRDMGILTGTLAQLGYWWAYRVLDAQYFGLAQRRRRVFIVASLTRTGATEVLFESESVSWDSPPRRETRKKTTAYAVGLSQTSSNGWGIDEERKHTLDQSGGDAVVAAPRLARQAKGTFTDPVNDNIIAHSVRPRSGMPQGWNSNLIAHSVRPRSGMPQVAATLNSGGNSGGFRTEPGEHLVAFQQNTRDEVRLIGGKGDHAGALTAQPGVKQQNYVAGMGVRRLTPVECERLQGFPDNWTGGFSDTARYKMLGNAVAVPVAEWIGKRLEERT